MKELYGNVVLFLLLLTVCLSWQSFAATSSIKKIFHHQEKCESSYLNAGSCVLYFDTMPKVIPTAQRMIESDKEIQTFFLPSTRLDNEECKRMVAQIHAQNKKNKIYTLTISCVQKPTPGILVAIGYEPGMCSVECKKFEAITKDKGLVFYVYNQKILDALQSRYDPIVRTASSGKHPPCIFIDNGHGGGDTGAVGCNNIQEKNISLCVGTYLAQLLKKQGYCVVLSRDSDTHIPLDERTTHANSIDADIFISIHANSASNNTVRGIETFCIKPELFTRIYSVFDAKTMQSIDMQNSKQAATSNDLASLIQKYVCKYVAPYQPSACYFNRGVKHAVAQVFFTHMPSILVEIGFLTNPEECHLLSTDLYQKTIAQALFCGICDYFNTRLLH